MSFVFNLIEINYCEFNVVNNVIICLGGIYIVYSRLEYRFWIRIDL